MIAVSSYIVFSALSGYFEAYFWDRFPRVSQRMSHVMLTVFRAVVMFPVFWYEGIGYCVGLACLFPLVHDGFYYQTRHYINPKVYELGWMDQSNTTGALISFDFPTRVILACIGIIIITKCSIS